MEKKQVVSRSFVWVLLRINLNIMALTLPEHRPKGCLLLFGDRRQRVSLECLDRRVSFHHGLCERGNVNHE